VKEKSNVKMKKGLKALQVLLHFVHSKEVWECGVGQTHGFSFVQISQMFCFFNNPICHLIFP
jgi:hypothetical protein